MARRHREEYQLPIERGPESERRVELRQLPTDLFGLHESGWGAVGPVSGSICRLCGLFECLRGRLPILYELPDGFKHLPRQLQGLHKLCGRLEHLHDQQHGLHQLRCRIKPVCHIHELRGVVEHLCDGVDQLHQLHQLAGQVHSLHELCGSVQHLVRQFKGLQQLFRKLSNWCESRRQHHLEAVRRG